MNTQDDPIEFVYFDLGNVLVSFDPAIACRNVADRFGVTSEQAEAAVYRSGLEERFERGEVTPDQFSTEIRRQLGRDETAMPTDQLLDAVSDMFTPIDSMRGIVDSVRAKGYRIGLLSNTCHAHWDWIERQPYFVNEICFDVMILSFQLRTAKPDAEIYRCAEQQAELPGERLLFLDDRPENVAAAQERGWKAVQCLGGHSAASALRELGVID